MVANDAARSNEPFPAWIRGQNDVERVVEELAEVDELRVRHLRGRATGRTLWPSRCALRGRGTPTASRREAVKRAIRSLDASRATARRAALVFRAFVRFRTPDAASATSRRRHRPSTRPSRTTRGRATRSTRARPRRLASATAVVTAPPPAIEAPARVTSHAFEGECVGLEARQIRQRIDRSNHRRNHVAG